MSLLMSFFTGFDILTGMAIPLGENARPFLGRLKYGRLLAPLKAAHPATVTAVAAAVAVVVAAALTASLPMLLVHTHVEVEVQQPCSISLVLPQVFRITANI